MRTVLIVSPHFPPINAPDMQRVRMGLPHLTEFGWRPVVLAVEPAYTEGVEETLLLETIPSNIPIHRVPALPVRWTRKVGLGNLGLRAFPFLYRAGAQMLKRYNVDLVYFSTTMFPTMPLGRIWKEQFGVPFVLDMQDPWVSDYHRGRPKRERPPKYWFAQRLNLALEPWTMKKVDGLLAVSADYIETLQRRYPWLIDKPRKTLPFGASETDFNIVREHPQPNRFFEPGNGEVHGVYVGRGGRDMAPALRIIFQTLRLGLQERPALFSKLSLHFIGTDYAPDDRARKTVEPVAEDLGIGRYVKEHPLRIPYFEALQLLLDSDFLLVPGSDDPQYTASKIFPYIMARKPLLAVFHERSSVVDIVQRTRAGMILPFSSEKSVEINAGKLLEVWTKILESLPFSPEIAWDAFMPYTAREMTRQQCELFDRVTPVRPSASGDSSHTPTLPCLGIANTRHAARVTAPTATAEQDGTIPADLVGARILVIMPSIPIQGMERANLQIMKMMRERGADVLFVTERTYGGKVRNEVERIGCRWTAASFISAFEERLHLTRNLREMAAVLYAWGKAAWEIDQIYKKYKPTHIYIANLNYFLYALSILWRAQEPVVFRIPNLSHRSLPIMKQLLYTWIWRYCVVPVCDVIVCNSQYTRSQLEKVGVKPEKARVIYNCVPERVSLGESDAPNVNPNHFNIVYLGRIRPEKGVEELYDVALRIVRDRDDVNFYFAGEREWRNPFAEALSQELWVKNLETRIQFTGEIMDVFGLLSRAHVHVLPSMMESFPNAVLEAKSHGVPSVVFPSGGIPEAVTHLVDGYICREKSAQALYEGIRYFLDDPVALKSAGEAAKQSLARFSRERIADEWADVFKSMGIGANKVRSARMTKKSCLTAEN